MTFLIAGAIVLVLFAFAFALWPLLVVRKNGLQVGEGEERQQANVQSFQDQLAYLDEQRASGSLSEPQYLETKAELERSLLEDSEELAEKTSGDKKAHQWLYLALVLLVLPVAVWFTYQSLGYSDSVELGQEIADKNRLEAQWRRSGDEALQKQYQQAARKLVLSLIDYVETKPDDLQMRVLLARESMGIGLYEQAIAQYRAILEQQPNEAQIMAELAQAVFVSSGNRAVPVVGMLAERVLTIEPENIMALGLAGISAFQNQSYQAAIGHWQKAIALQPEGSPNALALQNGIARARASLGENEPAVEAEPAPVAGQTANTATVLRVRVTLGETVPTEADTAVFVYARAWQGAKIPLAIARLTASELPATIELNNSMAMSPALNLASAEQVELVARLSPSGNAIAQPGDWQASLGPVPTRSSDDTLHQLLIEQPIQ